VPRVPCWAARQVVACHAACVHWCDTMFGHSTARRRSTIC
jgi:hypothetical protein